MRPKNNLLVFPSACNGMGNISHSHQWMRLDTTTVLNSLERDIYLKRSINTSLWGGLLSAQLREWNQFNILLALHSIMSLWLQRCRLHVTFLSTVSLMKCAPGLRDLLDQSVTDLPIAQRLMSGPSSMPSGQAQVYLGEWSVIWGAFRQRYSQPPLGRLPMLQVSSAWGTQAEIWRIKKRILKACISIENYVLKSTTFHNDSSKHLVLSPNAL